ncbi:MAG: HEAT repeat domain-containing protein, partial [Methanogenium sp.]|nr:HEAT repeat domain-containing protein [Methanogenium sp.]
MEAANLMVLFGRPRYNIGKMQKEKDVSGLIDVLQDDDSELNEKAARALYTLGRPAVESVLYTLKFESGNRRIRFVRALLSPGIPAHPFILYIIVQSKPEYRDIIGKGVSEIGEKAYLSLVNAIKDGTPVNKRGAAILLGYMGEKAISPLQDAFYGSDRSLQRDAAKSLAKLKWDPKTPDEKARFLFLMEDWTELAKLRKTASRYLLQVINDPDAAVRRDAVFVLGKMGARQTVSAIIRRLKDSDPDVRAVAIEALSGIDDPQIAGQLFLSLKDPHPQARMEAAWALDRIGWKPENSNQEIVYLIAKEQWSNVIRFGNAAINPLINSLKLGSGVNAGVVDTLGQLGRTAQQALLQAAKSKDPGTGNAAKYAIEVIRKKNSEKSAAAIKKPVDDPGKFSRELRESQEAKKRFEMQQKRIAAAPGAKKTGVQQRAALPTVGNGTKRPKAIVSGEPVISPDELREMIKSSDRQVVKGLKAVSEENAAQKPASEIEKKPASDEDVSSRILESEKKVVMGLKQTEHEYQKEALKKEEAEQEEELLEDVYRAPAPPEKPDTDKLMEELRGDEEIPVYEEESVDEDPLEKILGGLESRDVQIRVAAVESLRLMGAPAVEHLIPVLDDKNYSVRLAAAEALGEIGDRQAVKPLIVRFSDESDEVRVAVARALGDIGSPDGIPHLMDSFLDEYYAVRFAAVDSLTKMGSGAIPMLTTGLKHSVPVYRISSANALGRIGDEDAVFPLIDCIGDEVEEVRKSISQALGIIGEASVSPLTVVLRRGTK